MNRSYIIYLCIAIFASCSSPKKAPEPPKKPTITITREDRLNGGTSFDDAVPLKVTTERAGIDEEYRWLRNLYPGYKLIKRSSVKHGSKRYDIIRIRTSKGQLKDIYFDSTSFSGKR